MSWDVFWTYDAWCLFSSSVAIVSFSAYRSIEFDHLFEKDNELHDFSLASSSALIIPIVASISLVLFFYFFNFFSQLSLLMACVSGSVGMIIALSPLFQNIPSLQKEVKLPLIEERMPLLYVAMFPFTLLVSICWLLTGHWMLNNIMGSAITVIAICFLRTPSFKVATLVFSALFFYDIFWVFYSEYFFGESVMVSVATKQANNPAANVAENLNLPKSMITHKIDLPVKLIWGHLMLGLGDLVVPGLLVSLARRLDKANNNNNNNSEPLDHSERIEESSSSSFYSKIYPYFIVSVISFAFGLLFAMLASFIYRIAQPALLYIVPATLIPVIVLSYYKGELRRAWHGIQNAESKKS